MQEELEEPFLKSSVAEQKVAFKCKKSLSWILDNSSKPEGSSLSSKTSRRRSRAKRSPERPEIRGKKSYNFHFELKVQARPW